MWATCVLLLLGWRIVVGDGDVILNTTAPSTPSTSLRVVTPLLPEPVTDLTMLEMLMTQLWGNNDEFTDKGNGSSPELFNLTNRRVLYETSTLSPAPKSGSSKTAGYAQPINARKLGLARSETSAGTFNNHEAKPITSDKINQLRAFLEKYNKIVNQIMKNNTAKPMLRSQGPIGMEAQAPVLRVKVPGQDYYALSGDHLDMSPARGGKIHTLRARNRLCQRHVMIPEGPKYDSAGKAYIRQYVRIKDRDYAQTVPPKLLLPKCCNCCRKSVLGCE